MELATLLGTYQSTLTNFDICLKMERELRGREVARCFLDGLL